ncbi:MAG: hypothetical protein MJ089_05385 [Ruminococcus sp.]|nr:hypothetical protein [Ruminococcus sp.]
MSIFKMMSDTINRYGSCITVSHNNTTFKINAFIEPLRYKNRIYIGGSYRKLGVSHSEKYLYIGPATTPLVANVSVIEHKGIRYLVKRSEIYYLKDLPVYVWAILVPFGERLEDDYESD